VPLSQVESGSRSPIRDQIAILSTAEGFFQSSVLFALQRLRIFELIGDGERRLDELATELGSQEHTLARLLNAGVVLKLLETRDGIRYRLGFSVRSVLLPSAEEKYLGNWIRNLAFFERALLRLDEAVLKSGPTGDPLNHLGSDEAGTREFVLAMHNYAALRGRELAHYLSTAGYQSLLDLGCGPGTYAFHLGMANPNLKLYLLDLPGVLECAKEVATKYPLTNDIVYVPGDITKDLVSGEFDLILVSNTLHMLGRKASASLIKKLFNNVKPGGSLVIQAQFLRDDRLGERWPVFLDLVQLCITSAGENHTVRETRDWLEAAGFANMRICRMSLFNTNSFVRGYKL
jgi:SAM-dependent methyltransferase